MEEFGGGVYEQQRAHTIALKKILEKRKRLGWNLPDWVGSRLSEGWSNIVFLFDESIRCFQNGFFVPTIAVSCIVVESIINFRWEERIERFAMRAERDWVKLSVPNLRRAHGEGLPVDTLLEAGERQILREPRPGPRSHRKALMPKFILRRNKVMHGDIEGLMKARPQDFHVVGGVFMVDWLKESYEQLDHALDFAIAWKNRSYLKKLRYYVKQHPPKIIKIDS